jgi:hypothetical protein
LLLSLPAKIGGGEGIYKKPGTTKEAEETTGKLV